MANRFRNKPKAKKETIFNRNYLGDAIVWINGKLSSEEYISKEFVKGILWIFTLVFFYIFFQHNYERQIRKLESSRAKMNESRADYISEKSQYLFQSKQSEVEKKLKEQGLNKNTNAPIKIRIKED